MLLIRYSFEKTLFQLQHFHYHLNLSSADTHKEQAHPLGPINPRQLIVKLEKRPKHDVRPSDRSLGQARPHRHTTQCSLRQ